jgi:hypothetical protein
MSGICAARFAPGTVVALTQETSAGSAFQSWSANCSGNPCTIEMTAQRTVEATFLRPTPEGPKLLTITALASSRGGGTVVSAPAGLSCTVMNATITGVCSVAFAHGTAVTLSQTPNGNAIFQGWGGDCVGNPCQLSMTQARGADVSYRTPAPGIITIAGVGTGTGLVTSSPSGISCSVTAGVGSGICSAPFDAGTTVTLAGIGNSNASFDGFAGACTGGTCVIDVASGAAVNVAVAVEVAPLRLVVAPGSGSAGGGVVTSTPSGISCVLSGSTTSGVCSALFAANTLVTLQQSPSGNAVFSSWGGDCTESPCQLVLSQARTALATFQTQRLALTGGGTGTGSVLSVPAGINCTSTAGVLSGTCATTFPLNTSVSLIATAAGLSSFTAYSGDCTGTSCAVMMAAGVTRSITAQFTAPPTLTLSAATGSEGGGTLSSAPSGLACTLSNSASTGQCATAFALNTNVSVTQVPTNGSVFLNWAGACSGTSTCTAALTQSRAVQALYRLAVPGSVTVMAGSGSGNGSVSSSPGGVACQIVNQVKSGICRAIFPVGSTVSMIATPAAGYRFLGFSGSCTGTTCVMTVPENGDITVIASFAP